MSPYDLFEKVFILRTLKGAFLRILNDLFLEVENDNKMLKAMTIDGVF